MPPPTRDTTPEGSNAIHALGVENLIEAQRIAGVGSWVWDTRNKRMWWSPQTYRLLGVELDEQPDPARTPRRLWSAVHPDDREALRGAVQQAVRDAKSFTAEHRVRHTDGGERFVRQCGERLEGTDGGGWLLGTIEDVTEQRAAEERFQHLANYDSLTGLANRHRFYERLNGAIDRSNRLGQRFALIYMDLDGFKRVNDTLGHGAGDQLLQHVANLLRSRLRGGDVVSRSENEGHPQNDALTVSRLGGDEFTILLSHIHEASQAGLVAQRILKDLPSPVSIDGQEVSVTGSMGIAVYPEDGEDRETLVKHADTAMYDAKQQGRNTFQFFSPMMNEKAARRLRLEGELRNAIERGDLNLYYQPKWKLSDRTLVGWEALLRWDVEGLGAVSPKEIIPIAEETGLIHPLGTWVIEEACRQQRRWLDSNFPIVPVAVNVSTRQFGDVDFTQLVTDALVSAALAPEWLHLEITEGILLQDDENTASLLRDLRMIGLHISLDDFGTGYSSLSYLARYPMDSLKLDRAFIRDLGEDPAVWHIVRTMIELAHHLGLTVIAEGVDSDEQASMLLELGCDQIQGFLMSPALPAEQCEKLLDPMWPAPRS